MPLPVMIFVGVVFGFFILIAVASVLKAADDRSAAHKAWRDEQRSGKRRPF